MNSEFSHPRRVSAGWCCALRCSRPPQTRGGPTTASASDPRSPPSSASMGLATAVLFALSPRTRAAAASLAAMVIVLTLLGLRQRRRLSAPGGNGTGNGGRGTTDPGLSGSSSARRKLHMTPSKTPATEKLEALRAELTPLKMSALKHKVRDSRRKTGTPAPASSL